MNADNITENLLDAINVIVEEKIKKLNFDKTYKAIVIGTDKRDKGRYNCETEGLKYEAIGTPNEQLIGDIVYVNVPQNNWSKQKNIIGKSVMDENKINIYSPFMYFYYPSNTYSWSREFNAEEEGVLIDKFSIIANSLRIEKEAYLSTIHEYDNTAHYFFGDKCQTRANQSYWVCISKGSDAQEYIVNKSPSFDSPYWSIYSYPTIDNNKMIFNDPDDLFLQDYKKYAYSEPYDAIGIKVKFDTTELGTSFYNKIISGQYGIKINLLNSNDDVIGSYDYNSSDMIGNIYNSKEVIREQVFYVEKTVFDTTSKINFELYEDENFKWKDGNDIKYIEYDDEHHPLPENGNIKVEYIELYFGYDLKDFTGDELRLDTNDIKQQYKDWSEKNNTKTFFHSFLYRDETGKIQKDNNLVSSFWCCVGYNDNNWVKIESYPSNNQEFLTYYISQDQCKSNSDVIRFKAQIEWQNKLIDSNIVTLYKYDDGVEEG